MRQIDADALIKNMDGICSSTQFGRSTAKICVKRAPTVEPKRGEWISVKERLPEENDCGKECGRVLIRWSNGVIDVWNYILIAENVKTSRTEIKVTHWMPLPESPCGADMRKEEK